ncbi:hypothetical protein [Shewanella xiamenensis]|uniref:hypothetical protein n=1 Tax=Shewanella xiamenensis TaxID=332186 RepID=UPI00255A8819|nr:hypothetical protein [Shewanella xiamenensis]MDL3984602.1 hypothetical protein [Shewanella xiamenensis]
MSNEGNVEEVTSLNQLIDYAKSGWDDELKRFYSIDDKLWKLLQFVVTILVAFLSFLAWFYVHITEFKWPLAYLILATSVLSLLALISALLQSHKGMQLMDLPRPNMSESVLTLLDKNNEESASIIVKTYLGAIKLHREKLKDKEKCFELSSNDLIFSICGITTTLILLVILRGY